MRVNEDVRVIDLTVGELKEIIREIVRTSAPEEDTRKKEYAYGIKGLTEIFGCSEVTARRIRKSGVVDGAITKLGRKIVIDKEKALELARTAH